MIATEYDQAWHQLTGVTIAQPNTFSPDGSVTYVTSSQPQPNDCTVHAIFTEDGATQWCKAYPGAIWSAVEVDENGDLYFTTGEAILSLAPTGELRWEVAIPPYGEENDGAMGVHFTPDGHVAAVSNQGVVMILSRENGALLTTLDIRENWNFVGKEAVDFGLSITDLLPKAIIDDLIAVQHGDPSDFLSMFAGDANFSDNTISVAPNGDLYIIGGGLTATDSALIQVRMEGSPDAPILVPGWYTPVSAGSASSPGISPDGKTVKVSDGNSLPNFLDPANAGAMSHIVDIAACDANTDTNPDAGVCAPAQSVPLATGPAMGTMPMLNEAIHYQYETQFSDLMNTESVDLRAFKGDELLWEIQLPDELVWSSVITVTDNLLVGTATRFTGSDQSLMTVEFPSTAESELVLIDRITGKVVFRAPITDDSTSTVTIGADGSLYVTMLSLLHSMSLNTHPVGGMIRFSPR